MTEELLVATNIEYGRLKALTNSFSFSLKAGKVTALLGVNGRGKTTLLETLTGAIGLISGNIHSQCIVGFVPQKFRTELAFTVLDLVLLGRAPKIGTFSLPSKSDEEASLKALEELGIRSFADKLFSGLSGGEQQLVMIARALATQTRILILDEPASALDLGRQESLLKLIKRLAQEKQMAILFSTHDPLHASLVADETIFLKPNKEVSVGKTSVVLSVEEMKKVYGVQMLEEISLKTKKRLLTPDMDI